MPTARSGIAAAVLEGRMFVFGGEACAQADCATRPRRGGGCRKDLRHLGRANARRLGFGGQRDFCAVRQRCVSVQFKAMPLARVKIAR